MKNMRTNITTADAALEKIKSDIHKLKHPGHIRALMETFKLRESVFRRCFLTRGQQSHLLKTNIPAWNTWHGFVFPGVLPVTMDIESLAPELVTGDTVYAGHAQIFAKRRRFTPFILNEIAVRAIIRLRNADFTGCDLSPAHFRWGANLSGCRFDNANLEGAEFSECHFHGVSFKNANLRHVEFDECVFSNADFTGCDLSFTRGTSYFKGNISFDGACAKSNCLIMHCRKSSLAPAAQNADVKGRLISEGGCVQFIADPKAEENVEEWREW